MSDLFTASRRELLKSVSAGVALALMPRIAMAQSGQPIRIGSLTPLTGAGANYGGRMRDAIAAVVAAVNQAGGINGQQVVLISEDDQTSPEAGVRAARKLIDVDQVAAITGVWSSSVATAVAPLCWESKTMLFTTCGADSIPRLPHRGYIARTEPSLQLVVRNIGRFLGAEGAKKIAYLAVQSPYAQEVVDILTAVGKEAGQEIASVIYEADRTTYRSEVSQILAAKPDFILLGGYSPDTIIVLRDLYRAGYAGRVIAPNYTVDATLLKALPKEVVEGIFTYSATTPETSPGLVSAKALLKSSEIDPYTAQAYDHASLAVLALGAATTKNGDGIRTSLRAVSQGTGQEVGSAVEGLKLLSESKAVNFDGASGQLIFDDKGDISSVSFRYDIIKDGAFKVHKAS